MKGQTGIVHRVGRFPESEGVHVRVFKVRQDGKLAVEVTRGPWKGARFIIDPSELNSE